MASKTTVIAYLMASFFLAMLLVVPAIADSAAHPRQAIESIPLSTPVVNGEIGAPEPTIPLTVTATLTSEPSPLPTAFPTVTSTPMWRVSVRFEGFIAEVAPDLPGAWRIDDITFQVTADTVINTPEGHTPAVGDYVIVNALREGDLVTATRIRVVMGGRPLEFRGTINRLPADPLAGEWQVGGVAVLVDARSPVTGRPTLGYYADVVGELQQDRKVRAISIRVLNPTVAATQFEFEGPIEQMAPGPKGFWTVAGITGLVDTTVITNPTIIEGITPTIGAIAQVTGRRLGPTMLRFDQIYVLPPEDREIRVFGSIDEISPDGDYWVVAGREIDILETTFIDESRGRAAVGMWAEAVARRGNGGYLQALRIRVDRPD